MPPYQGSTEQINDYRCLVMDPGLKEDAALTGYEFIPDKNEFVHHALIFRMIADQRDTINARDVADPGTGYGCFGGVGAEGSIPSPDRPRRRHRPGERLGAGAMASGSRTGRHGPERR